MIIKNRLHIINKAFPVSYSKFLQIAKAHGYKYKTSGLDTSCIPQILKKKHSYITVVSANPKSFHEKVIVCIKDVYIRLPLYKVLVYSEKSLLRGRQVILDYVHSLLCSCLSGMPNSVEIVGYHLPNGTAQVIDHARNDGIVTIDVKKRGWHKSWNSFYELHLPHSVRSSIKEKKSSSKHFEVLRKKLAQLGTNKVTIREDDYDEKQGLVKLWYKENKPFFVRNNFFIEITLGDLSNAQSKRNQLLRHIIAYFRYNKSLVPVRFTDAEYVQITLKRSKGKFVPSDGKYHSKNHGDKTRNKIKCVECGAVRDIPKSGVYPKHCSVCNPKISKNYSRQGIAWLQDIEHRFDIYIQHAENGGEKRISLGSNRYHYVDGYSKSGNIVFEYHGSRWHGNPLSFYMEDKCNPYSKEITAYDMLLKTIRLERKIVNLGYTYVRIWDCDYLDKRRYAQWLVKNTKKIQDAIKQL